MARLLGIDYGEKRCGIAITDESQIVATGLTTVDTRNLLNWLKDYLSKEFYLFRQISFLEKVFQVY